MSRSRSLPQLSHFSPLKQLARLNTAMVRAATMTTTLHTLAKFSGAENLRTRNSHHRMKAAVLCAALVAGAAAPFRTFPLYKQCNSSWGGNEMGTNGNGERSTICGEGCAMSSLSMVLAGMGISINGAGGSRVVAGASC